MAGPPKHDTSKKHTDFVSYKLAEWAAALHHDVVPAGVADVVQGDDPVFGIVPDTVLSFTGGAGVAGKGVIPRP